MHVWVCVLQRRLAWSVVLVVSVCSCGGDAADLTRPSATVRMDGREACTYALGRTRPNVLGNAGGIALGCARARSGSRLIELYAFRDAGGPCIVIEGLPGGARACGRAPSERVPAVRRPIGGGVIVRRTRRSRVEIYGETTAVVKRIVLRYALPGAGLRTGRPTLIRVVSPFALSAAGISEPFGYFVGSVPAGSRRVVAEARDRFGRRLGNAHFSRLIRDMPPRVFIAAPG